MFSAAGEDPDREKARTKWWMNIRKSPLPDCLFFGFANSMKYTNDVEQYGQISVKISRLLEFGEKKGFDYDQILDSKPGISIAGK